MKKLNVTIKDPYTLVLNEDAKKGDYIDLKEIKNIDTSEIENSINNKKDTIYEKRFKEYTDVVMLKNNKIIEDLNNEINNLKKDQLINLKEQEKNLQNKYSNEINDLKIEIERLKSLKEKDALEIKNDYELKLNMVQSKYNSLNESFKTNLEKETLKIKQEQREKIVALENQINELKNTNALKLEEQKNFYEIQKLNELNNQKDSYEDKIKEHENRINELIRQKANLNVKQTGEDLETWCNSTVVEYMQNGFFNCEWIKDNKVVKEDDEVKGTKADYLLRIYESAKKEELLTSICFDMKDENPDSIIKKTNASYYGTLDKNRTKKECKYAVLVSNLERNNNLPMWRVREYNDMYVVRPEYLMTFINIIVSLTSRFADLVLMNKEEEFSIKSSLELLEEFNSLKETYLDKPLLGMQKEVSDIAKCSEAIISSATKINESTNKIINKYIFAIEEKLNKFEINIKRKYKKFEQENDA